jgi:hypothetical protein
MAKKVKVEIEVESNVIPTINELRELKKQLRETSDPAEFARLQRQIDDTTEAINAAKMGAGNLFDILGKLPGPIGFIGGQAAGLISSLKQFGQIKFQNLAASFVELKNDVVDIGAGILRLTGITSVYNAVVKTTGANSATASVGVRALAVSVSALYAALGIGVIFLLVEAGKAIYNMIDPTEREAAALKKLSEASKLVQESFEDFLEINTQYTKVRIANAKKVGASEQEVIKIQQEGNEKAKKITQDKIVGYQNDVKAYDDFVATRKKQNKELTEEEKKFGEESKKNLKDAQTTLGRLNTETYELESQLEQQKRKDRADSAKKQEELKNKQLENDKKDLQERQKIYKEELDELKKSLDYRAKIEANYSKDEKNRLDNDLAYQRITEGEHKAKLLLLDKEQNGLRLNEENLRLSSIQTKLKEGLEKKLITQKEYDRLLIEAQREYQLNIDTINQEGYDKEIDMVKYVFDQKKEWADKTLELNKEIKQSYIDMVDNIGQSFMSLSLLFERGSNAQKTFAILGVLANSAAAIGTVIMKNQEAQASYNKTIAEGAAGMASAGILLSNPITAVLGAIQMGASKAAIAAATAGKATSKINMGIQIGTIGAAAAAQIAAITSGGKSAASGGGGGGSSISAPSVSLSAQQLPAPTISGTATNNNQQLAGMIGNSVNRNQQPIKAYVLQSDITTANQFDRRVLQASKLG